jgi:hypothetical protein
MKKIPSYLLGDGLKKGNQLLRHQERAILKEALPEFDVFNPWEQKINDKSTNPTAELIFKTDTDAILKAEVIIADCDNDSVGSTTEIGQIWVLNYFHDKLTCILNNVADEGQSNDELLLSIRLLLEEVPKKKVFWQTTDIRHTQAAEKGCRRSFSINQYLYGCLLDVSGEEKTFEEIVEELKKIR